MLLCGIDRLGRREKRRRLLYSENGWGGNTRDMTDVLLPLFAIRRRLATPTTLFQIVDEWVVEYRVRLAPNCGAVLTRNFERLRNHFRGRVIR